MKFIQIKYLTFYLVLIIVVTCVIKDIQTNTHTTFPMYAFATPLVFIYTIIAIAYFFLKKRKEPSKYINIAINFGAIILAIFTLSASVLWIFNLDDNITYVSNPILIFVSFYQLLVVSYAIITGLIKGIKSFFILKNKHVINEK